MNHQRLAAKAGAVVAGVLAVAPSMVLAATNPFDRANDLLNTKVAPAAGITNTSRTLPEIVGSIINVVLGFLGVLLLVYILYAGFLWMTAGGDSKKVDEAKAMLKNAVIGLVIITAAFAISSFVLGSLITVTQT